MNIMSQNNSPCETPLDLSSLAGQVGRALRRAQAAVMQDFQRALDGSALRPAEFGALAVLRRYPGLSATRVAGALDIKRTNFVGVLEALEGRGLVSRARVAGDRRTASLALSGAGEALMARLERDVAAHEERLARRLGGEGRAQLLALLERLADPAPERARLRDTSSFVTTNSHAPLASSSDFDMNQSRSTGEG